MQARQKRKGTVLLLVAVCLTVMIGFVAIAVDGGLLLDNRQRVQGAADAAALAAANKLFYNWQTYQGLDGDGSASDAAKADAAANGFPNPTVNIPPLSGTFAGKPGYAEVIIQYSQKRYFATIFGSSPTVVGARAVAQGLWKSPKIGILVLDPTSSAAALANGGGTVNVGGVPMIVDSNSPSAMNAPGGGTYAASEFDITGVPGTTGSGNYIGTIYSGQQPTPDPLAYLPEPDPSTMTVQANHPTHISGQSTTTINPGVYTGGITVTGQGLLVMNPGIYYMDGGGFSFTGLGGLQASGVMIVNAPKTSNDIININGNGSINFSPPTSGIYKGISLWQTRSSTNSINISGNGGSSMTGTFYAQHGTLSVTGNGTNDVIGSQYISYDLSTGGSGSFSVNWNANQAAQTRLINLVE
jgi:Flp pilus assembly protein TadG